MNWRLRRSSERGSFKNDWLEARYSFSFAAYQDPEFRGFHSLCVLNDDIISPGKGFGMHPHENMEILSYITEGEIEHRDSMDNRRVLRAGQIQLMSAGDGVVHSERNSGDVPLKLLQIWISPERPGGAPGYQERTLQSSSGTELLVSPDGAEGSLTIRQQARVYRSILPTAETTRTSSDRPTWIQMVKGRLAVSTEAGVILGPGDGLAIEGGFEDLVLCALKPSEFLTFEL